MKTQEQLSKALSYVLRHRPDSIGITLDSAGWCEIEDLIKKFGDTGTVINREMLESVVAADNKKRYSISEDGISIRANQGHSVKVDLEYKASRPPNVLYHGTVQQFIKAIMKTGLDKMNRHDVHLSADQETARTVAARRGKPIILIIDAARMSEDGFLFRLSANGVWLTDEVPAKYITIAG